MKNSAPLDCHINTHIIKWLPPITANETPGSQQSKAGNHSRLIYSSLFGWRIQL